MSIGKAWHKMPMLMAAILVSGLCHIVDLISADTHRQLLILQSPPFAIGAPTNAMNNLATKDGKLDLSNAQISAIIGILVAVGIMYWIVTALITAKLDLGMKATGTDSRISYSHAIDTLEVVKFSLLLIRIPMTTVRFLGVSLCC
jgi:hypothetical protein